MMESIHCDASGLIEDADELVVHSVRTRTGDGDDDDDMLSGGLLDVDGSLDLDDDDDDELIALPPLGAGSGHDVDGTGVDQVLVNLSLVDSNQSLVDSYVPAVDRNHQADAGQQQSSSASGSGNNTGSNAEGGSSAAAPPKSPGVMGGLWPFGRNNNNSNSNSNASASGTTSNTRGGDDRSDAAQSDARSGATGTSASVRSARSTRSTRSTSSTTTILTQRVVKRCPNGDTFSGLCDAITGEPVEGRLVDAKTGEVYEGPFVRGRRHGEGGHSTRPADNAKFFGSFRNGDPYEGTLITEHCTYQGRLLIPQPASRAYIFHGPKGTLLHRNGDIYQGGFSHGRYHGRGRERSSSGLNYTGQFRSGKWHGIGDLIVERRSNAASGNSSSNHKQTSSHAQTPDKGGDKTLSTLPFNPDAFRYTYYGEWQHGEREGNGYEKIVFGKARPGQQQRQVAMATPSANRSVASSQGGGGSTSSAEDRLKRRTATYEGEFHRDRRHGTGILVVPDGTELRGFWKAGRPCVEPEEGEGNDDISGRRSQHRSSSKHHQHRHKSSRHHHHHHHHHHHGNSRGAKSVVFSTSWEIDYANGDRYRGEVALAPPLSSSGNADGMKEHLHITNSLVVPVVPHGRGTMIYGATGDTYEGKFRMGKRHGFGRCISQTTGEEFDGTWIEDIPGEIGGQRTHTSRPHFESSVAAEDSTSGKAKEAETDDNSGAAADSTEDAYTKDTNSDEEAGDPPGLPAEEAAAKSEAQAQHSAPAPGGILGIFGAIRRASHAQPINDQEANSEKDKAPGKSHDDKSQKSHDDKSMVSAASDKTQTMTNRRSTEKLEKSEDSLVEGSPESPQTNSKVLSHEERTLSTDALSLNNDERTLSTTDDVSAASDS